MLQEEEREQEARLHGTQQHPSTSTTRTHHRSQRGIASTPLLPRPHLPSSLPDSRPSLLSFISVILCWRNVSTLTPSVASSTATQQIFSCTTTLQHRNKSQHSLIIMLERSSIYVHTLSITEECANTCMVTTHPADCVKPATDHVVNSRRVVGEPGLVSTQLQNLYVGKFLSWIKV